MRGGEFAGVEVLPLSSAFASVLIASVAWGRSLSFSSGKHRNDKGPRWERALRCFALGPAEVVSIGESNVGTGDDRCR